ncbi:RIP metalloprotease RseP [Psychromonas sp. MME1]|uniref:RIP metalloprotease RseP n=1 Tax=Psychromonas sp. MME1 TaxID=3231032 RepID=UPI0034E1DD76
MPKKKSIISSLGFIPYFPNIHLEIADVVEGGAAQRAGLQVGDKLQAINGVKLSDWNEFVELIQKNANQTLKVEIERGTMTSLLNLTPDARRVESDLLQGYIGAAPLIDSFPESYRVKLQFSPIDAVIKGVEKTAQLTKLTFDTLVKLITGDVAITNLSGPVSIAKGAGMSANYGIEYFLGFLGLISVNLGLMNLIPLPVLDGGHLFYYFVELVTGKPIPEKVQEIGFKVGAALLMMLMSVAILNDFNLL